MTGARRIKAVVIEDGTFSCLARLTAMEASGPRQTGDLGRVVKQADLTSITAKVFDLGPGGLVSPVEITPAPTVVISTAISDTLLTLGWDADSIGYNFRFDLGPTYCATGGNRYWPEFKCTLTGGSVFWALFDLEAKSVLTS